MRTAKYQVLCDRIRDETEAGAVVIVFRGKHGSGYCVRADDTQPTLVSVLPAMLRDLAGQLDTELGADNGKQPAYRKRYRAVRS